MYDHVHSHVFEHKCYQTKNQTTNRTHSSSLKSFLCVYLRLKKCIQLVCHVSTTCVKETISIKYAHICDNSRIKQIPKTKKQQEKQKNTLNTNLIYCSSKPILLFFFFLMQFRYKKQSYVCV